MREVPFCPESFLYSEVVSYADSLAAEKKAYDNCFDIHELPSIFHYWSNRYILPKLESFGFTSTADMFAQHLKKVCRPGKPSRFVSLGAGNCDFEISLARGLKGDGHEFTLDCLDVNPTMLERGSLAAQAAGVSSQLNFLPADLNTWTPDGEYDAVLANQSLHHVVNVEGLFDQVRQSLRPHGAFLISDMIGRNGHQRWPEALDIVHEFWRKLPPSYRFHESLGCYEEIYQNWDCSLEGFEGVRSQDILPLLLNRFHFHLFLPFGNVIDPFIDRGFGHHFDPASEWDRSFIDAVHRRDEEELASGRIKPTHMIAIVSSDPCESPRFFNHSPEFCLRPPEILIAPPGVPPSFDPSPYEWHSWPHGSEAELEIACRRLSEAGSHILQRTEWALNLASQLENRTSWALNLERDVEAHTAWGAHLEAELEDRTLWASRLRQDLEQSAALARDLQQKIVTLENEVEERTNWALRVQRELDEQCSRTGRLEQELSKVIGNPFHFSRRFLAGIYKRLFATK